MSKWAGKYVIGLTGNIGTGKSVVRRMLEYLGAYGIDADALGHRAMAAGAPGYQAVIEAFGRWILAPDGEINRGRLARIVFAEPEALAVLERILHPLVIEAIDLLIQRNCQPVVVIEAIKLLEAQLHSACDSIWVTYAPPEVQLSRLVEKRRMSESEAWQRINAQPPQEDKMAAADVVIRNTASLAHTWEQVKEAWQQQVPEAMREAAQAGRRGSSPGGGMAVLRGKPKDAEAIADLVKRVSSRGPLRTREEVLNAFGEKAFLLLEVNQRLMGVLGFQVENLVARLADVFLDPAVSPEQALPLLLDEMEQVSKELQCEAVLAAIESELAQHDTLWRRKGYYQTAAESLQIPAWQEAARELLLPGKLLFFKQLRRDRISRPV